MVRIAINGFGRIGRSLTRALQQYHTIEIIAINDLANTKTLAHLLKYDSIHGRFNGEITSTENAISINGKTIQVLNEKDPKDLPWKDLNIDIVIESTGLFLTKELASQHLTAGAKKVILSAPPKSEAIKTVVLGINDGNIDGTEEIISNASCTTNCLAPLAKVLHRELGIEKGMMTTIHSYTGDQPTLDTMHGDLYRARAAAMSMIPTSTGAAKAVGLVLPDLNGKLDGMSVRVPTPNVSVVDLKFIAGRNTTAEEVNAVVKAAAEGELKGVLDYDPEAKVSIDFNHDPHSSNFAAQQTKVMDNNFVSVMSWYDNEWGFSNRMSDVAVVIGKTL